MAAPTRTPRSKWIQEGLRALGKVMSSPVVYRSAVAAAGAGGANLPRFLVYTPLNPWGRQREVPSSPPRTFRQWYLENRKAP